MHIQALNNVPGGLGFTELSFSIQRDLLMVFTESSMDGFSFPLTDTFFLCFFSFSLSLSGSSILCAWGSIQDGHQYECNDNAVNNSGYVNSNWATCINQRTSHMLNNVSQYCQRLSAYNRTSAPVVATNVWALKPWV